MPQAQRWRSPSNKHLSPGQSESVWHSSFDVVHDGTQPFFGRLQCWPLSHALSSLQAQGYDVLGISPDSPAKLAKFRERDGLTITLLSDADKAVMQAYDAFGEKKLYGKTVQGVIRSTFVVDEDGKVALAQYNVKAAHTTTNIQKIIKQVAAGE